MIIKIFWAGKVIKTFIIARSVRAPNLSPPCITITNAFNSYRRIRKESNSPFSTRRAFLFHSGRPPLFASTRGDFYPGRLLVGNGRDGRCVRTIRFFARKPTGNTRRTTRQVFRRPCWSKTRSFSSSWRLFLRSSDQSLVVRLAHIIRLAAKVPFCHATANWINAACLQSAYAIRVNISYIYTRSERNYEWNNIKTKQI